MTSRIVNPLPISPMPSITLIVAAYNIAEYIGVCLKSVLDNSSTDYEVIVVDDGSSDQTASRIKPFTEDSRLRYVYRDNGGLGAARNTGIDHATGKYIQFVDGDDWLEPGAVDTCIAAIAQSPKAELFVFDYFDIRGDIVRHRRCGPTFWNARNAAWNKLYRRDLIGRSRFDVDILYEDLARVRPWLIEARETAHLPKPLYNYRNTRPGSIMNSRAIGRFFELFTAAERCVTRIEQARQRDPEVSKRLGTDWIRRFYTCDIFVPGVLYWTHEIADDQLRHEYIAEFLSCLPGDDLPSASHLAKDFGLKIAAIAQLYRYGAYRAGDFLLRDIGRYRSWLTPGKKRA